MVAVSLGQCQATAIQFLRNEPLSGIIPARLQISENGDTWLPTVACGHALTAAVFAWVLSMSDVTRILNAIEGGDTRAADELLPLVYEELRLLAAQKLSHEPPGQTLQATALVHEAYIRLVGTQNQSWENKGHFFKAAAEAMRRILIENARRKRTTKRGGDQKRVGLSESISIGNNYKALDDIVALDEALDKLETKEKLKADLVKLRFYAGLTIEQSAESLGISLTTAKTHWAYARAWLLREVS